MFTVIGGAMDYPATLERDDDGRVMVRFPDLPDARAVGEYEADAFLRAREALSEAIGTLIRDRRAVPQPSRRPGLARVGVPLIVELKLRLYEAMRARHMTRADLVRLLKCHRPQVDRLLDVRHGSKVDQIEIAAAALGVRLLVDVRDVRPETPGPGAAGKR
jgi:antitoxin HicB